MFWKAIKYVKELRQNKTSDLQRHLWKSRKVFVCFQGMKVEVNLITLNGSINFTAIMPYKNNKNNIKQTNAQQQAMMCTCTINRLHSYMLLDDYPTQNASRGLRLKIKNKSLWRQRPSASVFLQDGYTFAQHSVWNMK